MSYDVERFFSVALDPMCIAGTDGYFKRVNPAFSSTFGWPAEDLLRRPFIEFVHPEDVDATQEEVAKLARGLPTVSFENRFRCADGGYRNLLWTSYPEQETGLLYAVARDITSLKLAQKRFELVIEASPIAMLMIDSRGIIRMMNKSAEDLFGYTRRELHHQSVEILVPEAVRHRHESLRQEFALHPSPRPMGESRDLTARRKDGSEIPVEIGLNPVEDEDGSMVLSSVVDLTVRKQAEEKIVQLAKKLQKANRRLADLALTDALTGLRNRRGFLRDLESAIRLAQRHLRPVSLLLADVDHFKSYNDRFGHPAGDEILAKVALVLFATARGSDFAARYGGEEFAIALPETDSEGATVLAERFRAAIESQAWPHQPITISVGAATKTFSGTEPTDLADTIAGLIEQADQALYRSKRAGRNRVVHASAIDDR